MLISLLVVVRAWSRPIVPQSKPYLVALGAPPLRFQEPAPPPHLIHRPLAVTPPPLEAEAESHDPADATEPEAQSNPSTSNTLPAATSLAVDTTTTTTTTTDFPSNETPAPTRTPPPILPDELRPQARPEDFLPFFQIPVSHPGDVNVVVPMPRAPAAPGTLPPSSATYIQTPR
ncbi:MAG TPA: hypothetical protein VEA63_17135 [Opitutus sp.]|nr:hypothetical protein [Opitutus sp.]